MSRKSTSDTPAPTRRTRRNILTEAEWEKIHKKAIRAEREPDEAQLTWLPDEPRPDTPTGPQP